MSSTGFEKANMLTTQVPLAITIPDPSLSIDKEARKDSNAYIEDRFEAAMQRRREFIEQRERDFSRPDCKLNLHEVVHAIEAMY